MYNKINNSCPLKNSDCNRYILCAMDKTKLMFNHLLFGYKIDCIVLYNLAKVPFFNRFMDNKRIYLLWILQQIVWCIKMNEDS